MGVLIDTNVFIRVERAFRQNPETGVAQLPPGGLFSAITLGELNLGVERAEADAQRRAGRIFIEILERRLERVDFGREEAFVWSRLHNTLRRTGRLIGERDLQIAATALAGGHSVMTGNVAEFSRVPGLDVVAPPELPPPLR